MTDVTTKSASGDDAHSRSISRQPPLIVTFKDGARILRYLPQGKITQRVVLFARVNSAADDPFLLRLIDHFTKHEIGFDLFESPLERAFGPLMRQPHFLRLPYLLRVIAKAVVVATNPWLWKALPPRLQGQLRYAKFRVDSFVAALQQLDPRPSIAIGRSAGAIAITRNAQALGLKALVCIGYPFRHPESDDEPSRYAHLATLQTPCLIIQGARDPYGDSVSARRYALSATTSLSFIDGDHNSAYSDETLRILLDRVTAFIHSY
ncbi:MAG: hypothetical protein P4L57_06710 [Rhizomicrobium sp.]|nr:hypothetical protein [Rhizomicrobium sp.]